MYETTIDLRLIDKIWRIIEANDDASLADKRDEVCRIFESIEKSAHSEWLPLRPLVGNPTSMPQQELAELTVRMVRAVLEFVGSVNRFFSDVSNRRAMTNDERQVGSDLSTLLQQARQLMPVGKVTKGQNDL